MHCTLPEDVQTRICYTGTKLGTKFNKINDLVKKTHQHDVVYYSTCLRAGCVGDFTRETSIRLNEKVIHHNRTEKKLHLYKHSPESNYPSFAMSDFKVIGSNFQNLKLKTKISESLLIRELRSSLNKQEMSIPLKRFI